MFVDADIRKTSFFAAFVRCSAKNRTDALWDDENGGLLMLTFREASFFAAFVCCS